MLDSDPVTFDSLKKLWGLSGQPDRKPLLVWVGAGASSWLGYERWGQVAGRFHKSFSRSVASYNRADSKNALDQGNYPVVFQFCADANPPQYRLMLADSFSPRPIKPVYKRFLEALERIEGASIATTNVDEMLERSLVGFELVQRSDISRAINLLSSHKRFIVKIHGSVSSVESMVFKIKDYEALGRDAGFIECLRHLLTACSVLFIGYGIRDQYVFELLNQNAAAHSLFGDGPHFLVPTDRRPELPSNMNPISYHTNFHADHRSSILCVELAGRPKSETASLEFNRETSGSANPRSAHLLSDFYPAGTWTSGQIVSAKSLDDGREIQMIIGPDWTTGEIPQNATAAHDLAIGLICFDQVLLPLECISRVFKLLGWSRFETVKGGVKVSHRAGAKGNH
jgi:hypothetical protein